MPRGHPSALIGLTAMAFVLAGGCTGDAPPVVSGSAPAPASSAAVDPAATEDEPGTASCAALMAAVRAATLMNPGVVDAVVAASRSADAPIADAAQRLAAAYAAAVSSKGSESEPDAVAAVSAAAADMTQVCDESGLDTVG